MTRSTERANVLEHAAEAIAQRGYHGMSMRDLARATGRGLASFYTMFASKEDILFELQERAFDALIDTAERAVAGERHAEARLRAFIANHVRWVVDEPAVMRVLVQEASALPPARRAAIRALKQRYFAVGEALVDAVMRAKGTDVDPLDVERATYCLFGMLNWIYGWYEPERHGPPDAIARTIFHTCLRGFTP